jgi:hypothetical protein
MGTKIAAMAYRPAEHDANLSKCVGYRDARPAVRLWREGNIKKNVLPSPGLQEILIR